MDDCETLSSHMMASANALNLLYMHLHAEGDDVNVEDFVCPKLFAGMPQKERSTFLKGVYHILSHVDYSNKKGVYMFCNTGNAYGAAAGPNLAKSLNGHCYGGLEVQFTHCTTGKPFRTLLEGTKWVMPLTAASMKHPDVESLKLCNEISSLLMEATKHPKLDPTMDVGGTLLQIYQGAYSAFFMALDLSMSHTDSDLSRCIQCLFHGFRSIKVH